MESIQSNHEISSNFTSQKFPISIKGIIKIDEGFVLLKNERDEWELPGGKLEIGEKPEKCLIREIHEELCIDVKIDKIVDVWVYNIMGKIDVLIVTYLCIPLNVKKGIIKISDEHKEMAIFKSNDINILNMPQGYKNSIQMILK